MSFKIISLNSFSNNTMLLYSFLLFIVLYNITKHTLNKLRNLPPSPFPSLPIIGHLYLVKKPLHRSLAKISRRHGPVLFLQLGSRPVLHVSSPSAAEECLTKFDIIFANRPQLLAGKHLGNNHTNLTYASYGHHWRNLRRIATLEILSSHRLQMLAHIRADEVRQLIKRIVVKSSKMVAHEDRSLEMKRYLFELMLNNMMRMVAHKRYYGDVSEEDADEAKRLHRIVNDANLLGGATDLSDFLRIPRWVWKSEYEDKLIELQKKRVSFMQGLVDERREILRSRGGYANSEEKMKCMIDVLLSLQMSEPEHYSDDLIRGLMQTLITSGTDSSAGVMEWAVTLLLTHPKVLKKAQSEIDLHVGHDRLVNESDLSKLPYLHCIIKETLRLYPAGPLLPHESSEDCTIAGYHIPRGTMLLLNLWAIQHDPKIWDEAEKYKPERFEDLEGVIRDGFRFIPFGFGRRGCPAENLALRMVGLTLASLLQCFEWETCRLEDMDMTEKLGISLTKAHSLRAKCTPRSVMMKVLSQL